MKKTITKCPHCGAYTAIGYNICEYCGSILQTSRIWVEEENNDLPQAVIEIFYIENNKIKIEIRNRYQDLRYFDKNTFVYG